MIPQGVRQGVVTQIPEPGVNLSRAWLELMGKHNHRSLRNSGPLYRCGCELYIIRTIKGKWRLCGDGIILRLVDAEV